MEDVLAWVEEGGGGGEGGLKDMFFECSCEKSPC